MGERGILWSFRGLRETNSEDEQRCCDPRDGLNRRQVGSMHFQILLVVGRCRLPETAPGLSEKSLELA
jgi:hypothetical protein